MLSPICVHAFTSRYDSTLIGYTFFLHQRCFLHKYYIIQNVEWNGHRINYEWNYTRLVAQLVKCPEFIIMMSACAHEPNVLSALYITEKSLYVYPHAFFTSGNSRNSVQGRPTEKELVLQFTALLLHIKTCKQFYFWYLSPFNMPYIIAC